MEKSYNDMWKECKEVWRGDEDKFRWITTFTVVFKDEDGNYWIGEGAEDNAEACEGSADGERNRIQKWLPAIREDKVVKYWVEK